VLEVDALEALDQRRDEMPARLLAVADDVDAGSLLIGKRQAHRVALARSQALAFE
jgi:hypothetical protein